MSQLKFYNSATSAWEPVIVGATGPTGPAGPAGSNGISGTSGVISVTGPITNSGTSTEAVLGLNESVLSISQSQVVDLTSDLALKAPIDSAYLTGITHINDLVIDGELTFSGTATTINSTNLEVTDSLIYLAAEQYTTDAVDIGIYGAYGNSNTNSNNHPHAGFLRDASDGKWKLISSGPEPSNNIVNFANVVYDTLIVGTLEGDVVGNVSGNAGTVTNGVYTTDTGTVTDTMLAGSISNSKLSNSSITINGTSVALGNSITIDALPSQTGNSGKYLTTNGSSASWATLNASPALDDLSDVAITSVATNDVVYYNGTSWVNKNVSAIPVSINAQTGTTYTTVLSDAGKIVEASNASAITLTVPTNASVAYPIGTQITILQTGVGQVTVAAATPGTTTVNATPGLKLRAQWSSAVLTKRANDTWVLTGDLTA